MNSATTISAARVGNDGSIGLLHGDWNYNLAPAGTWQTNIMQHIWIQYTAATSGANGVVKLWKSNTSTRPGTPTVTRVNGSAVLPINKIQISGPLKLDHIRVSTSDMGNNPP